MDASLVRFRYRNHKGIEEIRTVRPIRIWFGSSAWHPDSQWLLEGFDLERMQTRDYAMSGILGDWKVLGQ